MVKSHLFPTFSWVKIGTVPIKSGQLASMQSPVEVNPEGHKLTMLFWPRHLLGHAGHGGRGAPRQGHQRSLRPEGNGSHQESGIGLGRRGDVQPGNSWKGTGEKESMEKKKKLV